MISPARGSSRIRRVATVAAFVSLVAAPLALASPLTADAASCVISKSGYAYTGFVTCYSSFPTYEYVGLGALVSDGAVSLGANGKHIIEYVDAVADGTCGQYTAAPSCWEQGGWGYGNVDNKSSGPDQRPYVEKNDEYTGNQIPIAKFYTTISVNCCSQTDYNNTSTYWTGQVDGNNYGRFTSYFNNTKGSGVVTLGTAYLPGDVSVDMTGEEDFVPGGALPSVGPVSFAGAELDVSSPGVFTPWTTSFASEQVQSTSYYPFSSAYDFTSFTYAGP